MNRQKVTIYIVAILVALWLWPAAARAQSTTTTTHGTGLRPLVEETGSSQTLNIYGPGGLLIVQVATDSPSGGTATTQTRYLLHDHLGSTRVVLDESNQVLGSFDYTPFGETTVTTGATGNVDAVAYRYTGQEINGELETYNFHARQYDAGVGRFDRVDPARQFASSYVYVGNNSINLVDFTGQEGRPLILYREVAEFTGDRSFRFRRSEVVDDADELGVNYYSYSLYQVAKNLAQNRPAFDGLTLDPNEFNGHVLITGETRTTRVFNAGMLVSESRNFQALQEDLGPDQDMATLAVVGERSLGEHIGRLVHEQGVPLTRITSAACNSACGLDNLRLGLGDSPYRTESVRTAGFNGDISAMRDGDPPAFYVHASVADETGNSPQRLIGPVNGLVEERAGTLHTIGFTQQRYSDLVHQGSLINDRGTIEPGAETHTFFPMDFPR